MLYLVRGASRTSQTSFINRGETRRGEMRREKERERKGMLLQQQGKLICNFTHSVSYCMLNVRLIQKHHLYFASRLILFFFWFLFIRIYLIVNTANDWTTATVINGDGKVIWSSSLQVVPIFFSPSILEPTYCVKLQVNCSCCILNLFNFPLVICNCCQSWITINLTVSPNSLTNQFTYHQKGQILSFTDSPLFPLSFFLRLLVLTFLYSRCHHLRNSGRLGYTRKLLVQENHVVN